MRLYELELRGTGMNPAQFELLAQLRGAAGVSQIALGRRMDVDQTTLSRNLKLLVAKGLVAGAPCEKDRRRVEYRLTAAGLEALEAAEPRWARAMERVTAALGAEAEGVWVALAMLGAVG